MTNSPLLVSEFIFKGWRPPLSPLIFDDDLLHLSSFSSLVSILSSKIQYTSLFLIHIIRPRKCFTSRTQLIKILMKNARPPRFQCLPFRLNHQNNSFVQIRLLHIGSKIRAWCSFLSSRCCLYSVISNAICQAHHLALVLAGLGVSRNYVYHTPTCQLMNTVVF